MSSKTISTGETTTFGSVTEAVASSNRLDLNQQEILDENAKLYKKELDRSRNNADVDYYTKHILKIEAYKQFQGFLNSDDNLAEFVQKASEYVSGKGHSINIYSTYYKDLINKAIAKHGEQSITLPGSIRSYKLKDILNKPELREHFNLQEVKDILKGVIEDELSPNSDFMIEGAELQQQLSKESVFAAIGFRDGLTGPGFRAALVGNAIVQPLAIAKRNKYFSYDSFSGKHAFMEDLKMGNAIDDFIKKDYLSSDEGRKALEKHASRTHNSNSRNRKKWKDLAEQTKQKKISGCKADFKGKIDVQDVLKKSNTDDVVEKLVKSKVDDISGATSKIRGFRKEARAARYARQAARAAVTAKKASTLATNVGRFKKAWTAISTGFKLAGTAGGPVGILATFAIGFAVDLVFGELIETVCNVASGEDPKFNDDQSFSVWNPMTWGVGKFRLNNLGEGLTVLANGAGGFILDGFGSASDFVVDGSAERRSA